MNKAEKYKEQIVKILMKTGRNIAVNKETDEPMSCCENCTKCKFFYDKNHSCYTLRAEWLNEEHNTYTIPLDTPIDTKVLVSNDGINWKRRYFSHFNNDEYKPYACLYDGATSWATTSTLNWEYCKLWSEVEEHQDLRRRNHHLDGMKGGNKMFFKSKTKNEIELMNREILLMNHELLDLKRRIKWLERTRGNSEIYNNDLFKKW